NESVITFRFKRKLRCTESGASCTFCQLERKKRGMGVKSLEEIGNLEEKKIVCSEIRLR
ncbi:AAEL004483-PA, partial [Aedes aegypti]